MNTGDTPPRGFPGIHGDTPPHGHPVQTAQRPPAPWKLCSRCSAQTQTTSQLCPWCGAPYAQPARSRDRNKAPKWIVTTAIVLAVLSAIAWGTGNLDPWLSQFGLNKDSCLENYLTGNVVCGDDARDFCDRLAEPPNPIRPDACKDL